MFENDADTNSSPSQNNDTNNTAAEYLRRAAQACAAGDAVLGMHLYLAAFEKATHGAYMPNDAAIDGLRQAWRLACKLKERSLAEYIFEKLEPYMTPDEVAECAEQLQRLALDKLEEFGLTREDLEDMTDMISQDFLGLSSAPFMMKVEHRETGAPSLMPFRKEERKAIEKAGGEPQLSEKAEGKAASVSNAEYIEKLTYRDIVGFRDAVKTMNGFGVGMQDDPQFQELVETLNVRHGLKKMPIIDTYLFRAPVREDANQFMSATLGEIGLPAIRMHMEENLQGMPVLCVMAQADNQPKLNAAKNAFEGGGILVLEDVDLWGSPLADAGSDEMGMFAYAQLSRGAREAINLIRSAVENPEVYVLASAGGDGEIDGFFYDLLDPVTVVDIDDPSPSERADLWIRIASEHPSMRSIDRSALVRYSAGMSRFDIYMAAREAVEDAYKASLVARRYMPVTADNMFEKLAAYQPLDSEEYRQLEDAVIEDFRAQIDRIDDLLNGMGD
ncbi:ribonucleotide reductase subunit alpha [Raoultibacter massiliensis]|uniref:Ribonucleotide reductase subunit alpha n=1 Tax=Raoultibacter massiliensis TaxID=1852371 RepID=A0ABV1JC78_9ACTN|nr:ribonucleotide reductase subunit alpha [Raoultibacter massiliensis]